jgi:MFS family permease
VLRDLPGWLRALLVGQLVNAAGSLAWLYLTLWLVHARHLAPGTAGAVVAAYGVGAIAGNLWGGSWGDRWGLREVLAASRGLELLACVSFPVCPTPLLGPLALLTGLSGGAGRPLMSAVVAAGVPAGTRRQAIALSRAANNAGVVLGPPLGGLLAVHHFGWVFVVDAATSALLLAVVLARVPRREVITGRPRHGLVRLLLRDGELRTVVGSVLVVDTTYRLLYTALPLFLTDRGAPGWVYGLTISLNGLLVVGVEPLVARRLAHRHALGVIAGGYALVGAGWLVLGVDPSLVTAFVAVLVISGGEVLYKPTATAHAADLAPPGAEGRYQSLYASASIGGMVLSPLLGTALYGHAPRAVWPLAGALALAAAAVVARSPHSGRRGPSTP